MSTKGTLRRRRFKGDTRYNDNYGAIFGEKTPWWMREDVDEHETVKGSAETQQPNTLSDNELEQEDYILDD